jgi:hypothetical protein
MENNPASPGAPFNMIGMDQVALKNLNIRRTGQKLLSTGTDQTPDAITPVEEQPEQVPANKSRGPR